MDRVAAGSALVLILGGCSGMTLPTPRGHYREPLAAPPEAALQVAEARAAEDRIAELQRRIDRLERRLAAVSKPGVAELGAAELAATAGGGAHPGPGPGAELAQAVEAPAADAGAVSDEELGRALSRTLVEQGGLVLPPFAAEITPELSYAYRGTSGLQIFEMAGVPGIGFIDTRQDTLTASVTGRLGLPYSSQVEVSVPFAYDRVRVDRQGFSQTRSDRGIGDLQVSLSKQLLRERRVVPDLLGSVTWRLPTGSAALGASEPSLGAGYHALRAGLTAVKSQDPLVYFGTLAYTWNLSDTVAGVDIDPGDMVNVRLGTVLAVSPQTSLRAVLDTEFRRETEIAGMRAPGSDDVAASLELGVAAVLTDRMLLDVTAGFGVTEAAPDFRFGIALPYRF